MGGKIGIIADDLTGANDSGVQLAKKGFSSTVVFNLDGVKKADSNPDVLVVDTNSRAVSGEEAHGAVVKAASLLFQQGYSHVYKKIDSTLRGNVAAEISAVASIYKPDVVVIVPAFPKVNRTTVNGYHFVNGKLITETEFGRDPKTPVTEAFIPELLKKSVDENAALVDLDLLRGSEEKLASFVEKAMADGYSWFVCDSETEEDLKAIAKFFAKSYKKIVWAGSGGLIEYLPAELEVFPQAGQDLKKTSVNQTLIVSGSLSQVTKNQLESLKGLREIEFIEINPVQLVEDSLVVHGLAANKTGSHNVIYVDSSELNRVAAREAGERMGLNSNQVSEAIATGLAKAAKAFLEQVPDIGGLVLTGGDIAKAVCGELDVNEMELHSEVEAGLPFGRIKSGEKDFWAITKAGGFGNEDSLVKAVEYMDREGWGNMKQTKPVVGITLGDAAGVGPEIILKTLANEEIYNISNPFVIGDSKILERAKRFVGSDLEIQSVTAEGIGEIEFKLGTVHCLDLNLLPGDLPVGEVSPDAGHAAFEYLRTAIELANDQKIDAICTAPLNKEALQKGGHKYPGHTEILADLTGTQDYSMMLSAPNLRVIHVTTHVGIIDAVKMINPERVYHVIKLAHDTLRKAGIEAPKIAVCGINPHAGENGLFGYGEEDEKVVPGVEKAQGEGIDAVGPLPADTLFFRAVRGDFDIVVAMYHDQGHGPVKVLGLDAGVNITVGLPIIRTSVDHGTAFDIAGKGIADEKSLIEAMRQAVELAPKR